MCQYSMLDQYTHFLDEKKIKKINILNQTNFDNAEACRIITSDLSPS